MEKKFEEAIVELEEIVKQLQAGNLSLDESMDKFKAGVELANLCNSKLQEAEKSITMLVEQSDGTMTQKEFEA